MSQPMHFADRADAANRLARALMKFRGCHPLVLAIPRGGVPLGRVVADALDGELDVVLVRKLGAPHNPEFAIGAIDENGSIHLADYAPRLQLDPDYVRHEAARQLALIRRRRQQYSPHRAPIDPAGRIVIIVDDGLATGETMRAALSAIRARDPKQLVCAVPVAAGDSLQAIAVLADEVVCLSSPADFYAVGQFYDEFSAVDDDVVTALLSSRPTQNTVDIGSSTKVVRLPVSGTVLIGDLQIPQNPRGLVLFAHGSGSSRHSPRNRFVAQALHRAQLATLLLDLLSEHEDLDRAARFDIDLLTERLTLAVDWARRDPALAALAIGLFGASTGAAAALAVAAQRPDAVAAVVSRGGRPDLAGRAMLARVSAPTLLIVGGADTQVLELNQAARREMPGTTELVVVPGATHLFEEPGALEQVAALAGAWFARWLAR